MELRKTIAVILLFAFLLITPASITAFADNTSFIVQPVGGNAANGETFVITWEISGDHSSVVLQQYDDGTSGWTDAEKGIGSPYVFLDRSDVTLRCRLCVHGAGDDIYSDEFTVVWKAKDDITTAELVNIDFGKIETGYGSITAPVCVKNTGEYEIKNPNVELGCAGSFCFDITVNKDPAGIPAMGTDDTTWSVVVKEGLEPGEYTENIFFIADNLQDSAMAEVKLIVEGKATYSSTASTVTVTDYPMTESSEVSAPVASSTNAQSVTVSEPVQSEMSGTSEKENTATAGQNASESKNTTTESKSSVDNNNGGSALPIIIVCCAAAVIAGCVIVLIKKRKTALNKDYNDEKKE